MASIDSLPGDQRAVLQLVLGRGRSYAEIARLLTIEPEAVRDRAVAAIDALAGEGIGADVAADDRERISDYLLGQLPDDDVAAVRDLLARSPRERAWARIVSSELSPLSPDPLPELPERGAASRWHSDAPAPSSVPSPDAADAVFEPPPAPSAADPEPEERERPRRATDERGGAGTAGGGRPRSSRRGGAVVIGLVVIVVALIVVFVVKPGHHDTPSGGNAVASDTGTTPTSTTSTSSSASASGGVVTQINLRPAAAGSKAVAVAQVIRQGSVLELAVAGQDLPPNTKSDSYEVWLYNSQSDAHSLGFVNPGIGKNGRLSAATQLPANVSHYQRLVITRETSGKPTAPGTVVLEGTISGL